MRRVIVGTAGHIDHGKTRLVEAITGIDCDRWDEERRRGITIDLGFAHLNRDDLQLGFIDVPGHERFLRNALAGLGGIRIVMLVVAADEGIKPQTLEHFEICSLLDIPRALVVLTKSDLVAADLLELAELEVAELLQASPWPEARVIAASSETGAGIEAVVEHLTELTESLPERDDLELPVRLPIDRAFSLRGLGSIVTGTLVSGRIETGQTLEVLPGNKHGKVRSVQVHGEERSEAVAGERTALQLAGLSLADLERGQQLAEPGTLEASASLLVQLELLASAPVALSGWTEVQTHVFSSEVVGKVRPLEPTVVEPGASCLAEVRLAAPLTVVRGDRFIVRRPSPAATLGGGIVLDPDWRRPRGGALNEALAALAGTTGQAIRHWVSSQRLGGAEATLLARRLGLRPDEVSVRLHKSTGDGELLRLEPGQGRPPRWIAAHHFEALERAAAELLSAYLAKHRLAPGMPRAEAAETLLSGVSQELVRIYFGWLESRDVLSQQGDVVNLPGRQANLDGEESELAKRLRAIYDAAGLQPPAPVQVARDLGAKPQIVEGLIHFLTQQGQLVKLGGGLVISATTIDQARRDLLASGLDEFTVAQFKDHFQISRKWAIPLLEYFDSQRITFRSGDTRRLAATQATE